ncbi:MAG: hypothetical protein E7663_06065 [Ruminococcaceae bacterium]|nr:hypothetical protein [Oscillospiraceae bacterium]
MDNTQKQQSAKKELTQDEIVNLIFKWGKIVLITGVIIFLLACTIPSKKYHGERLKCGNDEYITVDTTTYVPFGRIRINGKDRNGRPFVAEFDKSDVQIEVGNKWVPLGK